MHEISVILLAGGKGTRLGSSIPKQFLKLGQKTMALYSLDVFFSLPDVKEVIVVCEEEFFPLFSSYNVKFAKPGNRRQDSLFNGFAACNSTFPWVCVHDAARPLISKEMCQILFEEGKKVGAATLGMPVKWTVKECCEESIVKRTLDRSKVWEIQTPQFLRKKILYESLEKIDLTEVTVTDDVSLAELLGYPVKLINGSYANLKVTTKEDLIIAEKLLNVTL